jgi:hypothetical protein
MQSSRRLPTRTRIWELFGRTFLDACTAIILSTLARNAVRAPDPSFKSKPSARRDSVVGQQCSAHWQTPGKCALITLEAWRVLMAHSFGAFAVPDSHVSFLHQHPGLVHDYLEGVRPNSETASPIPADWPTEPPESLGSWGANHRNTDLYHWILNGGPELVTGAGSIFQTWYEPDQPGVVLKLDQYNERFALHANQLDELAALLKAVDSDRVYRSFCDWLKSRGEDFSSIDRYACDPFVDEFNLFSQGIEQAMRRGYGLIW